MFIVELSYKVDLSVIDKFGKEHVEFLEKKIHEGSMIFSGRKNPRTGGIFLINLETFEEVESLISEDCFYREKLADYRIINFTPIKFIDEFRSIIFK